MTLLEPITVPNEDAFATWTLLASSDLADSYEVDEFRIYQTLDEKVFIFASASGCSCWDGDWQVEFYFSLDDMPKHVLEREGYEFNPSIAGIEEMVRMAKEKKGE